MQFLVDFFPLLLFLGTFLYYDDIYLALKVLMVAMPIAFLIKWWITGKVDKMLLGSTGLLLVLGTATLLYRDPVFLFWKPTVFYWLVAVVFLASQFIGEKPVVQRLFAAIGKLPAQQWQKLSYAWVIFFTLSGFINLYVAFNYSLKFWASFKVFGFTALTFLFIIGQTIWLVKNMKELPQDQQEAE